MLACAGGRGWSRLVKRGMSRSRVVRARTCITGPSAGGTSRSSPRLVGLHHDGGAPVPVRTRWACLQAGGHPTPRSSGLCSPQRTGTRRAHLGCCHRGGADGPQLKRQNRSIRVVSRTALSTRFRPGRMRFGARSRPPGRGAGPVMRDDGARRRRRDTCAGEHLAVRLAAIPGVVAVTLGGSRATETAVEASDWDLGLYYRDRLDPADVTAFGWPRPGLRSGRVGPHRQRRGLADDRRHQGRPDLPRPR